MKKRIIKKRISSAINGRVKTGAEYFWPKTSDGAGLLVTEYRLPEAVKATCAKQSTRSGHAWYYGHHVAALYWLPTNGEPEEIFDYTNTRNILWAFTGISIHAPARGVTTEKEEQK